MPAELVNKLPVPSVRLDLTALNPGILAAQVPEFAMLDFPYLFNNTAEAHEVIDGEAGEQPASHSSAPDQVLEPLLLPLEVPAHPNP